MPRQENPTPYRSSFNNACGIEGLHYFEQKNCAVLSRLGAYARKGVRGKLQPLCGKLQSLCGILQLLWGMLQEPWGDAASSVLAAQSLCGLLQTLCGLLLALWGMSQVRGGFCRRYMGC